MLVTLSSLKPFFGNGLKKARHFSDNVGAEDPGIHEERPPICLAQCPHSIVQRHRSALSCLTASMMGTASPASTTSMTEGGYTRHGRGGTLPCRTLTTGLWEHVEDAHGLSGFRTGPSGRTTHDVMSCLRHRSPAAGMPAPPRPQRHSCWPTRPRGPRGCRPPATPQAASAPVRPGLPRRRIARERGHELALSSAPCHRRLRAGRCVGIGDHGSPACWGSPADPCRAYPSVHQACRPVPIY